MWWMIPVAIVISFLSVAVSFYVTVSERIAKQYFMPVKRTDEALIEYESSKKGLDKALLGVPYEELSIASRFGYDLSARFYNAETESNKIVVLLHGHNSSSVSQIKYLPLFRARGYNIFIPDHRASGKSGGKGITFGDKETTDGYDWITLLKKRFPSATFGIYGESMGGAVALRVAELIEPEFVVSYAAYTAIKPLFNEHSRGKAKYFMPMISFAAHCKTGARLKDIDGEATIRNIKCPILLMHGVADRLIKITHMEKLLVAALSAGCDVQSHIFQNNKHTGAYGLAPNEFVETINKFITHVEEKQKCK